MIDRLKDLIDASENNPKVKNILLMVAKMPEGKQERYVNLLLNIRVTNY